jgi:antitoxin CptB
MLPNGRTDIGGGFVYSACLPDGRDMLDERRKRLKFRAWRRGFREIDLILGGFADAHAERLDEAGLTAFEALLEEQDLDVYDWILGRAPTPRVHETDLMAQLRLFRPQGSPV